MRSACAGRGGIARIRGQRLAIDAGEVRPGHGLTGEPTRDPSFDCPALWIVPSARDHAVAEGFLVVDPASVIATHANQALLAEAHQLLGPDEVREWVDGLKQRAPALVEAVTACEALDGLGADVLPERLPLLLSSDRNPLPSMSTPLCFGRSPCGPLV